MVDLLPTNLIGNIDLGFGIFLIIVISLLLGLGILLFLLWKLFHWLRDFPIKAIVRTQRANGETYIVFDKVGRFYDKTTGKEYCRLRGSKINFSNIPYTEIEGSFNQYGFVELFRSTHDEIFPCKFTQGELKPILDPGLKFWLIEGLTSDFKRYSASDLWSKYGQMIFLASLGIIMFLLIIGLTSLVQQYATISSQITGATNNYAAGEEYKLKSMEIGLLLYGIENKIMFNSTEIFKEINITMDKVYFDYNFTKNIQR